LLAYKSSRDMPPPPPPASHALILVFTRTCKKFHNSPQKSLFIFTGSYSSHSWMKLLDIFGLRKLFITIAYPRFYSHLLSPKESIFSLKFCFVIFILFICKFVVCETIFLARITMINLYINGEPTLSSLFILDVAT